LVASRACLGEEGRPKVVHQVSRRSGVVEKLAVLTEKSLTQTRYHEGQGFRRWPKSIASIIVVAVGAWAWVRLGVGRESGKGFVTCLAEP